MKQLPSWLRYILFCFVILGVPAILAILIPRYDRFVADDSSTFRPTIILLLWWALLFGWLKFYEERKSFERFVIKMTRISPEDLQRHISEAQIIVPDWEWRNGQIDSEQSAKARNLIDNINKEYDWEDV